MEKCHVEKLELQQVQNDVTLRRSNFNKIGFHETPDLGSPTLRTAAMKRRLSGSGTVPAWDRGFP